VINGLRKPESLYAKGMKPCISEYNENGCITDWTHGGTDIVYEKMDGSKCFTLSFAYDFVRERSITFFSYCFPYTYTKLGAFLQSACVKCKHNLNLETLLTTAHGILINRQ
jgi:hypothetical protein